MASIFYILQLLAVFSAVNARGDADVMQCYNCLDINQLETESAESSIVEPFRGRFVDLAYGGVDPGTCDNVNLTTCPTPQHICIVSHEILTGIYSGVPGALELWVPRCITLTEDVALMLPPGGGCIRTDKVFNMTVTARATNATLISTDGSISCTCSEDGCNHPSTIDSLHCMNCLDVTILEDSSVPVSLYDQMVEQLYGGEVPSSCRKPEIKQCPPGEDVICSSSHSVMNVERNGSSWSAEVWTGGCVDTSKAEWKDVPDNDCDEKSPAEKDEEVWADLLDVDVISSQGDTCGCDGFACNRRTDRLRCYNCMDLTILESEGGDTSFLPGFRFHLAIIGFGGVEPGTCQDPPYRILACPTIEHVCVISHVIFTGVFHGTAARVQLLVPRCVALAEDALDTLPPGGGCVPTRDVFNLTAVSRISGEDLTDLDGNSCFCFSDGCNHPKDSPSPTLDKGTDAGTAGMRVTCVAMVISWIACLISFDIYMH